VWLTTSGFPVLEMSVAVFTGIIVLVYLFAHSIICLTQYTINLWQRWIDILMRV
jgi:hypothetical protein